MLVHQSQFGTDGSNDEQNLDIVWQTMRRQDRNPYVESPSLGTHHGIDPQFYQGTSTSFSISSLHVRAHQYPVTRPSANPAPGSIPPIVRDPTPHRRISSGVTIAPSSRPRFDPDFWYMSNDVAFHYMDWARDRLEQGQQAARIQGNRRAYEDNMTEEWIAGHLGTLVHLVLQEQAGQEDGDGGSPSES